jgi:hypothetical protein
MAHVTFVHGIGNKPRAGALLDLWLGGLATPGGLDLRAAGITSGLAYWADVFYERPIEEGMARESLDALEAAGAEPVDLSFRERGSAAERAWTAALQGKLQAALAAQEVALAAAMPTALDGGARELAEGVLLPWFVRERLLETLLRDAHHYLWNAAHSPRPGEAYPVEDEIRRRTVAALEEGASRPGPHVVIGHGMGAVIAYDCLKRVAGCPAVDALVTLGSPLGLDEIQERLTPGWTRRDGFPGERLRGSWMNVYDRLDPVTGFDPRCAEDFLRAGEPAVQDVQEPSYGSWRHGIAKYLRGPRFRSRLGALLGMAA